MELSPLSQPLLPMQRCSAESHDSFGFSTLSAFLPACSELPQTRPDSNSPLKYSNKRGNRKRTEKGPEAKLKPTMKKGWFCQDARPVATAEGLFCPHLLLGSTAGFSCPAWKAVPQGNCPGASPSSRMGQRGHITPYLPPVGSHTSSLGLCGS